MSKEMIISVNGREKKIAIVENGQTTEFYIERGEDNSGVVGNIYKGRVQRVLPGMQSAFVDIGLERDAFLYVSDFFDEEEEIERIVMEKQTKDKKSVEEADREATDEIHKTRLKRDKQIDNVQEKAEIVPEDSEKDDSEDSNKKNGRSSRRSRDTRKSRDSRPQRDNRKSRNEKESDDSDSAGDDDSKKKTKETGRPSRSRSSSTKKTEEVVETKENKNDNRKQKKSKPRENVLDVSDIEFEDSSFERIIDEDDDTGEMLKDAMTQEAIIDKVRSIEFNMESVESAEVGSLLDSVPESGFKRIADEDEAEAPPQKIQRGRKKKEAPKEKTEDSGDNKDKKTGTRKRKSPARKSTSVRGRKKKNDDSQETEGDPKKQNKVTTKKRQSRAKKTKNETAKDKSVSDDLEGASASVTESQDVSEMTVRRGSRGGRRRTTDTSGGKKPAATTTHMDKGYKASETEAPIVADDQIANAEFKKPQRGRGRRKDRAQPKITDLLNEGQEILVQIAKEPIARKGARITSHIALPGRFLVYMPTIEHLGVSRKIESAKERGRLRNLLQSVITNEDIPSGGFIVRTAGVGKSEEEIREDARYLAKTWTDIKQEADKAKSKTIIHQDLDIILRLLRDHLSDDFSAIRVDSEEEYTRIVEFVNKIQPKLVKRIKFHTLDEPILDTYGVSEEIDKALKHRVWLKSGGYLVINQTEALIAIDVNTGKFVGKGNARLEDTITKTNMEAVKEIARQIRLRDLGGIIVLDLIDMEDRNNRKKVLQLLQEQLSNDKSPTKVLSFNDFGLIIMTRKRVKQSLERTLCSPCTNCEGAGWIKSAQTVCYEILEESRRLSKSLSDVRQTTLRVHPDVARALQGDENEVFDMIENYLGVVDVNGDNSIHQEQFDFAFI